MPKLIIAIILIALGAISLTHHGIKYTTREKVIDMGPIQITKERREYLPLSPLVGVLVLVGGLALLKRSPDA